MPHGPGSRFFLHCLPEAGNGRLLERGKRLFFCEPASLIRACARRAVSRYLVPQLQLGVPSIAFTTLCTRSDALWHR
jgi:hypothetical protein